MNGGETVTFIFMRVRYLLTLHCYQINFLADVVKVT